MRLIDVDYFKEQIAAATLKNGINTSKGIALMELVDAQPTAYDVDKVVKQLEEKINNTADSVSGISARMAFGKAIEIIKKEMNG